MEDLIDLILRQTTLGEKPNYVRLSQHELRARSDRSDTPSELSVEFSATRKRRTKERGKKGGASAVRGSLRLA